MVQRVEVCTFDCIVTEAREWLRQGWTIDLIVGEPFKPLTSDAGIQQRHARVIVLLSMQENKQSNKRKNKE